MRGSAPTYASRKSYLCAASSARAYGTRRTPSSSAAISSLARSWIHFVISVPAGPPSGGLYLKPPSGGGLCDGVTTTPSARCAGLRLVVIEDRPRQGRRRREAVAGVDQHRHVVGGEHLERRGGRRCRQGVRVRAEEQRAVDALFGAVFADRLAGRDDVVLVERVRQRRSAMPGRPERDLLFRTGRVGVLACSTRSPESAMSTRSSGPAGCPARGSAIQPSWHRTTVWPYGRT